MFPFAFGRNFKGIPQNAIEAPPSENGLLCREFKLGALIKPAANARIFAFIVFANNDEIDVAHSAIAEWRLDSWHKPSRSNIRILFKCSSDWNQEPPERNVIRNTRKSYRAEEDGIMI